MNMTQVESMSERRRILHTMLRVGDMQRSIDFYTRVLGMQVLRRYENRREKYHLCFMGYQDESSGPVLELTYNLGVERYDHGSAYGHIAIQVDDCRKACAEVWEQGAKVTCPPTRIQGMDEVIAFVEDPDGYAIELVQRLT